MPPRLTTRQILITGIVLAAIGAALALVTNGWLTVILQSADVPNAIAGSIAIIVREICMTLGLVLIGVSLLARIVESTAQGDENGN
ncbi:hypothetical protein ITJ64_11700 [Herbiconiux sp. VKM Ac-1786]|uniref:hypothetical protein n=1 Tax=Herbiconiux sp. VKM Ac-1786 TaxID=2783824 RepID=UPI00188BE04B|nr:hypothetical protein [Herbiconiux sp. VKM Ac-1786]MBF4573183.1 hypothetical protein [Herbiconiux sp. VKM Ac-1786]